MKTKDQTLSKFINFLEELQKHFGISIFKGMQLHVDNDSCYIFGQFKTFADAKGIILDRSDKYVAQTNSRAEVVWRDTVRVSNSILLQYGLDTKFWPLSLLHANWLRNRTPQAQLEIYPVLRGRVVYRVPSNSY